MVGIAGRKQLETWLKGQGREVAVVIAARAALRVLPFAIDRFRQHEEGRAANFVLSVFRAIAAPWTVGKWPTQGADVRAAADFAADTASTAAVSAVVTASSSTADAASSAAATAASIAAADAVEAAIYTVSAAVAAPVAADRAFSDVEALSWAEITADAAAIESGLPPDELICRSLWSLTIPVNFGFNWDWQKDTLTWHDENWQVWTDWYDDRLAGAGEPYSRPLIEELERQRVLIPNEEWEKGPRHVNAIIANLELEYRAKPPLQRAAIIEVEFGEDGRLHRRPSAQPQARNEDQADRLRDAWTAHSKQLTTLEGRDFSNFFPALGCVIRDYRYALGEFYDEMNVVALGVHGTRLVAYAERADEGLLEDAASELVALAASHGLFIRQFDTWIAYLKDATGEPSRDMVEAAVDVARSFSNVPEVIGEDVTTAIEEIAEAVSADDKSFPVVAREFLRSIGNVLSEWFRPLVDYARDAGSAARDGSIDGIRALARRAIIVGGSASALALSVNLAAEFGWIRPALELIKRTFGL